MILSGLFKDYCVYLGDKLLSICRNRNPNTFILNSMLCNTMQKHSNTAENKHLISLFVEICCTPTTRIRYDSTLFDVCDCDCFSLFRSVFLFPISHTLLTLFTTLLFSILLFSCHILFHSTLQFSSKQQQKVR